MPTGIVQPIRKIVHWFTRKMIHSYYWRVQTTIPSFSTLDSWRSSISRANQPGRYRRSWKFWKWLFVKHCYCGATANCSFPSRRISYWECRAAICFYANLVLKINIMMVFPKIPTDKPFLEVKFKSRHFIEEKEEDMHDYTGAFHTLRRVKNPSIFWKKSSQKNMLDILWKKLTSNLCVYEPV